MSQYDAEVDLEQRNTSHTQVVELVGRNQRVLDVGCWKGELGQILLGRGCSVDGVDISADAVAVAQKVLGTVEVADLDRTPLSEVFAGRDYDVIVFADVLEHLMDPPGVLADAASLLAPGGHVVVSLPNVTHGSVRLALLQGRWDYTETGLLDRTHIRFFSRTGTVAMAREAGFAIDDLRATMADVIAVEVHLDPDGVPETVVDWVRHQPDALCYQFVFSARPVVDAAAAPVPELVPAEDPDAIRPHDRFTEHTQAALDQRHRLLTLRDHVMGLEAAGAAARSRAAVAETAQRKLRRRLEVKNETIVRLRRRLSVAERDLRNATATGPPPLPAWRRVRRRVGSQMRGLRRQG